MWMEPNDDTIVVYDYDGHNLEDFRAANHDSTGASVILFPWYSLEPPPPLPTPQTWNR